MEMISYGIPFYKGDILVGVMGIDVDFSYLVDLAQEGAIYENGRGNLVDLEQRLVYFRKPGDDECTIRTIDISDHFYNTLKQADSNKGKLLPFSYQGAKSHDIDGVRIECFLVPGHTWGHMVYLIDDKYLFTGDTLWFGADGGYSFISSLAEDNKLAVQSLAELERKLRARGLHPYFITGHTGWTDNFAFAFAHKDKSCSPFKKRVHDPSAPYDAYDESDDTEENAKSGFLKGVGR